MPRHEDPVPTLDAIAADAGDNIKILPDANARQIPGNDLPSSVNPNSDEVVTQVISVRNINAAQLTEVAADKGDTANVGVIALEPRWYEVLERFVTRDRVARHFAQCAAAASNVQVCRSIRGQ